MRKTIEDLEKLNTVRLLSYYKAVRSRYYSFYASCMCECCGEFLWHIDSDDAGLEYDLNDFEKYLELIRSVLNKRGHVLKSSVKTQKNKVKRKHNHAA